MSLTEPSDDLSLTKTPVVPDDADDDDVPSYDVRFKWPFLMLVSFHFNYRSKDFFYVA